MSKTKDKWTIEREEREAQRKALFARAEALAEDLRKFADDLAVTSKKYNRVRVEPQARNLIEQAHYSLRRVKSGNLFR